MLKLHKAHLLGLLPDSLVMTRGPATGAVRYLTFDDGPIPEHTPRLLDLLAANDARASFFVIGKLAEQSPQLIQRIVAEGHALGNHSYTHPSFAKLDLHAQVEQIDRCDHILEALDGCSRRWFRPPRGATPLPLLWHCLRHRRRIAYWSRDSFDYRDGPLQELTANMDNPPPRVGEVVLMHDDSSRTIDMLELLLPRWRTRGYRFEALPPVSA